MQYAFSCGGAEVSRKQMKNRKAQRKVLGFPSNFGSHRMPQAKQKNIVLQHKRICPQKYDFTGPNNNQIKATKSSDRAGFNKSLKSAHFSFENLLGRNPQKASERKVPFVYGG